MSVSIELPCGCRINEAFVLGMCMEHALELDAKKLEDLQAYRKFEEKMTPRAVAQILCDNSPRCDDGDCTHTPREPE